MQAIVRIAEEQDLAGVLPRNEAHKLYESVGFVGNIEPGFVAKPRTYDSTSSCMSPDEIAKSYDEIAHLWNGEDFPRDNGILQHGRAIAFAKNKGHAIDIGCGSSGRFIDLLMGNGFEVEGLDISSEMIKLATRRHPGIKFHHADICTWTFPKAYDFISAWDSIWHVPLPEHERVLKQILQGLTSGGVCIFTAGGLDAPDEKMDSEMGPRMYYSALGLPNILRVLSETGCICRHLEYDQYPELHLYVIAQKV